MAHETAAYQSAPKHTPHGYGVRRSSRPQQLKISVHHSDTRTQLVSVRTGKQRSHVGGFGSSQMAGSTPCASSAAVETAVKPGSISTSFIEEPHHRQLLFT